MTGHMKRVKQQLFKAREKIKELEAENARLRQQRDAANAQLDFILENLKTQQAD